MKPTLPLLAIAAVALLFAACSKDREPSTVTGTAKVHVTFSDFAISQGKIPSKSAEDPANYTGVGAMTLAFYASDGTEMCEITQLKSDATTYTTFGEFDCDLPVGNYTMVALGYAYYDGDVLDLTSPTAAVFTSERPREMFCYTQSVTVTSTAQLNLTATLNRINAKVILVSTDGRPAEATKIRTTYSGGSKGFNPTTGLATDDLGFSQTNNPATSVGATISVNIYPFLYTDEETMTVTIEALDASDNVLITKTVPSVPLKRNRQTTLTGAVYTPGSSTAGFQLETSWLPGTTVTF